MKKWRARCREESETAQTLGDRERQEEEEEEEEEEGTGNVERGVQEAEERASFVSRPCSHWLLGIQCTFTKGTRGEEGRWG